MTAVTGVRVEDAEKVTFTYCPAGGTCMSVIIIHKEIPIRFEITECQQYPTYTTWEQAVAAMDAAPSVIWE